MLAILFLAMIKSALSVAFIGSMALGLGGWVAGIPFIIVMLADALVLLVAAIMMLANGRRGWMTVGLVAAAVPAAWLLKFWLQGGHFPRAALPWL